MAKGSPDIICDTVWESEISFKYNTKWDIPLSLCAWTLRGDLVLDTDVPSILNGNNQKLIQKIQEAFFTKQIKSIRNSKFIIQ